MYVAFLLNFFTKLLIQWGQLEGRYLILYLIVVVKSTDIGAYFTGCYLGKHKLIPRISPAKTWEGCIGGVLFAMLISVVYYHTQTHRMGTLDFKLYDALILGLILSISGVVGDLIESLLKRASGVKDSGAIIQGMGGLLDVVDSLLFAAPLLYVYVLFFMH
jgi:phosphatidate cytidylyltransferase